MPRASRLRRDAPAVTAPKSTTPTGLRLLDIDGVERRDIDIDRLNEAVRETFSTPTGELVLRWLRGITIERVNGPLVEVNKLLHMEGQRFLVGLIEQRKKKATK